MKEIILLKSGEIALKDGEHVNDRLGRFISYC